jgi:predicted DNA-binding transcriptional regulator AlpA
LTILISTSEIAKIASVKKATVSTWKRRYENFPRPVTHKLYNKSEIEAWLEERKKR